jgi:hypothetical protein
VLRHLIVPESQLGHATGAQPGAASLIALLLWKFAVLAAIKLDGQPQMRTIEIQNVRSGGMLSPKLKAVWPTAPELAPQPRLHGS